MMGRLSNGEYPGANTRTTVLKIIMNMPINKQHILSSRVGGLLTFTEKKKDEIRTNRELATKIKEKWKRVILDENIDYSMLHEEQTNIVNSYLARQELRRRNRQDDDLEVADPRSKRRAKLAEEDNPRRGYMRSTYNFLHRPKSSKLTNRIKKMRDKMEKNTNSRKLKKLKESN